MGCICKLIVSEKFIFVGDDDLGIDENCDLLFLFLFFLFILGFVMVKKMVVGVVLEESEEII